LPVLYLPGMDTRIGYPNEHLAGDSEEEIASPLYATAVGLLMNALKNESRTASSEEPEAVLVEETVYEENNADTATQSVSRKERKSVFDKWSEKLKDFLDNAE